MKQANVGIRLDECLHHQKIADTADAPEFLRVPFIHSGYRVGYTAKACLKSLFQIHNETVNVWSHLIGGLFLLYLSTQLVFLYDTVALVHVLMPVLYLICAAYACLASAMFHLFNCIDCSYHKKLRTLDFGGIAANILGISWPTAYYAFYCSPAISASYILGTVLITPLLLVMPFIKTFHERVFLRLAIYIIFAGIPAYCGLHLLFLEGLNSPLISLLFIPISMAYLFFGSGMLLYATRYPERLFPGMFDFLGTSHQLWHVLSLAGQFSLYVGVTNAVNHRLVSSCNL